MTIEQLFGTLQQSIVDMWQAHLKTDKHDVHVVLDDYYKDMPELIDTLIENYMGKYGKVLSYENILNPGNFTSPTEYLVALRELVGECRQTISASELQSDIDAILSFIDSTVYKLRELCNESEEIEFTLEEGAGEYNDRLIESCKGCKKDSEEECETGKKSKKGTKTDKEEEETLEEAIVGRKIIKKKYAIIDKEEECETGKKKPVKESLADFVSRTLK